MSQALLHDGLAYLRRNIAAGQKGHDDQDPGKGCSSPRVTTRTVPAPPTHVPSALTVAWRERSHPAGLPTPPEPGIPESESSQANLVWSSALALSGQFRRALECLETLELQDGTVRDRVEAALWHTWCQDMLGRPQASAEAGPWPAKELTGSHDSLSDAHRALLLGAQIASASRAHREVPRDSAAALEGLLGEVPPVTRGGLSALLAMAALSRTDTEQVSGALQATHAALLLDEAPDDAVARGLDGLAWLVEVELEMDRVRSAECHGLRGLRIAQERGFHPHSVMFATLLARHSVTTCDTHSVSKFADAAESAAAKTDSGHLGDLAERARSAAGLSREIGQALADQTRPLDALSRREEEIAVLLSQGYTNQRIARILSISQKTVETHLGRIFRKLMVSSRAEVAFVVGCSRREISAHR